MSAPQIHTFGKKQRPEDEVRTRLRAHMMAGGAPKALALAEGSRPTTALRMLQGMNIKKVFITEEEHALILKMRRAAA